MKTTSSVRWILAAVLAFAPALTATVARADTAVTAQNTSDNTDTKSGGATASNSTSGFVGLQSGSNTAVGAQDVEGSNGQNIQDGDNEVTIKQETHTTTGAAVGGQVIGAVVGAGGNLTINATNTSKDVDIETGEATGTNDVAAFVGLATGQDTSVNSADITDSNGTNLQDGDNEANISQSVTTSTGDGVAGQVIGAVVEDGTTDITAKNTSEDVDIETGNAGGTNTLPIFVGLNSSSSTSVGAGAADIERSNGTNLQDGDNTFDANQSAVANSGDGVGGQVLGVVSAGDTSIDAANETTDADIETGETTATNAAAAFVGLNSSTAAAVAASDVEDSDGTNLQDGDNDSSVDQSASAVSGDAVAGQVAGVTTSAGGSADLVLFNQSEDTDLTSGESTMDNVQEIFTGLNFSTNTLTVGSPSSLQDLIDFALS